MKKEKQRINEELERFKSHLKGKIDKNTNDSPKEIEPKKKRQGAFALLLITIIVVAVATIVIVIASQTSRKEETLPVFSAETMLQEVLDIAELSGARYTFNGVTKVADKNGNDKYYVKYNGSVEVGIHFEDIEISTNEESKQITILVPQCVFLSEPRAKLETLEYIFFNEEYNTEKVSEEAYKMANSDLKKRASADEKLFNIANENMRTTIEALTKPIITQFAPEYNLIVISKEDVNAK